VSEDLFLSGPWNDDTVSYTYSNRLRTGLSLISPNASAWAQSYAYDLAKRLTNTTSPAGAFGYHYHATRNTEHDRLSLPNGAAITNDFDSIARLLSTTLKNSGGTLLNSHAYSYNPANQRTQVFTAGDYINYGYDNIGQLVSARGKEAGGADRLHEQLNYSYDKAGNLSNRVQNLLTNYFNVNPLNELTTETNGGTLTVAGTTTSQATSVTVSGTGLSFGAATLYGDATWARPGAGFTSGNNSYTANATDSYGRSSSDTVSVNLPATNTFAYDLNGNLRTNGTRVFDFDDENQLITITESNAWKSEFVYDGKLRRRIRREFTWSSGSWLQTNEVRYVYDGNLAIQERWFYTNISTTIPAQTVTYTRGRDLSGALQGAGGIGSLLARSESGLSTINSPLSTSFYHADGNGNVTCLVNTNQITVAEYLYDPFGKTASQSGSLAGVNLCRFSSKEIARNGMYDFGYRFYAPELQRWSNRDPLGEQGGANLHAYAGNDAVGQYDPLGLQIGPGYGVPGLPSGIPNSTFTYNELKNMRARLEAQISSTPCKCCAAESGIKVSISAKASGATVTSTADVKQFGCIYSVEYFWWDCVTAQSAGNAWWHVTTGINPTAWQSSGYYRGEQTIARTHKGETTPGRFDANHWDWRLMALYTFCGTDGFKHALLDEPRDDVQWTWNGHGWTR
jgi:RHS repeat-associated protein